MRDLIIRPVLPPKRDRPAQVPLYRPPPPPPEVDDRPKMDEPRGVFELDDGELDPFEVDLSI